MSVNKFRAPEPEVVKEKKIEIVKEKKSEIKRIPKFSSVIGTINELIPYLGIIKCEHFSGSTSSQLFLFARFTHIQETLLDIQNCVSVGKIYNSDARIRELDGEIRNMNVDMVQLKSQQIVPGASIIECKLLYARSLSNRIERHIGKDPYFNKLSDYLLALSNLK
jgi:cob(I)alamin adenosyltransferase